MSTITLSAISRESRGKAAARRMRRLDGQIPGVVYGSGKDAQSISLSHKDVMMALEDEATYSSVLELKVDEKAEAVVLKGLQRHPYKPKVLHVDFLRINQNEALTMSVPLHFVNEESAVGVKVGGGIVSHVMTEVEIKCLPKDLPEYIEVDVANLECEHSLHLSDVSLPAGVEFASAVDADHDLTVVSIQKPRAAKVEEPTEGEADAEVKSEGDKPAEDA